MLGEDLGRETSEIGQGLVEKSGRKSVRRMRRNEEEDGKIWLSDPPKTCAIRGRMESYGAA